MAGHHRESGGDSGATQKPAMNMLGSCYVLELPCGLNMYRMHTYCVAQIETHACVQKVACL